MRTLLSNGQPGGKKYSNNYDNDKSVYSKSSIRTNGSLSGNSECSARLSDEGTPIQIKREDLSPVSRFREEQKGWLYGNSDVNNLTTSSSSSYLYSKNNRYTPTTDGNIIINNKQETSSTLSPSSSSQTNIRQGGNSIDTRSTKIASNKVKSNPSCTNQISYTSKSPSNTKYDYNYLYETKSAASMPTQDNTYRSEFSDNDEDKIC